MFLDDFYHLLKVVVWVLVIIKPIRQLLECLEEAIKVHLIIITPAHHILVNDIIVCFKYMVIG